MSDRVYTHYTTEDALALVSEKWSLSIIRALRDGHNRYGKLQRAIPEITRKMLTQTLRRLERNGLIERIDYDEIPPRVEYAITPLGQSLVDHVCTLCEWSNAYFHQVEAAQAAYDSRDSVSQ